MEFLERDPLNVTQHTGWINGNLKYSIVIQVEVGFQIIHDIQILKHILEVKLKFLYPKLPYKMSG